VQAAEEAFNHMLGFANDVGLFAEEIDTATGAAIGNFPQAYTHIGVINAAVAIERAREEARVPGLESRVIYYFFLLWAFVATVAMTAILEGSQGMGYSRLSLPS